MVSCRTTQEPMSTPGAETAEEIITPKTLFEYFKLYANANNVTYREFEMIAEKSGFSYSASPQTNDSMAQIVLSDGSEYTLSMLFWAEVGNPTITTASYGNSQVIVECSDWLHTKAPDYSIAGTLAGAYSGKGKTIEELEEFIFIDAPRLIEQYSEELYENETINVTISPTWKYDSGTMIFTITTNLPNQSQLMITVKNQGKTYQGYATVKNGIAESETFGSSKNRITGESELKISMSAARFQTEEVQRKIGKNGEFLSGEYVVKNGTGDNYVSATFTINAA